MIQSAKNEVFWTQVFWIDLILLMLIELNEFQCLRTFIAHEGSFKSRKKSFLNDSKCQNEVFLTQGWWIDLTLYIRIELNVSQHLATLPGHGGSFKSHKNAFLNNLSAKKEVFGHYLEFGLLDRLDSAPET